MERLEAALEKARQERRKTRSNEAVPTVHAPDPVPQNEIWDTLKTVKISPRLARHNRITTLKQGSDSAPYDLLRSRAVRIMGENNWRRLAVTSPTKSCGKTTVSMNLAISLARQTDLRVLALDLDLRRPALNKILGQQPKHSLHEVLAGKHPIESAFVKIGDNLAVGLNKAPASNPSELLQSKRSRNRLDEIQELFQPDFIILDIPPMLASDEVIGILPQADCGLLIGAADTTTISQLDVCEKELAELTNVLGVVLNKSKFTDPDSGYDYDYY